MAWLASLQLCLLVGVNHGKKIMWWYCIEKYIHIDIQDEIYVSSKMDAVCILFWPETAKGVCLCMPQITPMAPLSSY